MVWHLRRNVLPARPHAVRCFQQTGLQQNQMKFKNRSKQFLLTSSL